MNAVTMLLLTPRFSEMTPQYAASLVTASAVFLVPEPKSLKRLATLSLGFCTPLSMCLAPRALVHASLGQRPRKKFPQKRALKARIKDGVGFNNARKTRAGELRCQR
jgi:hypothetical protein